MRRTMLISLLTVALVSCGGSSDSTGPSGSVTGTYTLKTVNSQALPFLLQQDQTVKLELTDDEITLNADRSYSEVWHERATLSTGGVVTQPGADQGTYSVTNGAITTVSSIGQGSQSGSLSGSTLTLVVNGVTEVFKR